MQGDEGREAVRAGAISHNVVVGRTGIIICALPKGKPSCLRARRGAGDGRLFSSSSTPAAASPCILPSHLQMRDMLLQSRQACGAVLLYEAHSHGEGGGNGRGRPASSASSASSICLMASLSGPSLHCGDLRTSAGPQGVAGGPADNPTSALALRLVSQRRPCGPAPLAQSLGGQSEATEQPEALKATLAA